MALYDSADCLQRFYDSAQLPLDDEAMTPPAVYRLLTESQAYWYTQVAAHVPQALIGAPVQLESTDGGVTYPYGDDVDGRPIVPLGVVQVFAEEWQAFEPDPSPYLLRAGLDYVAEATLLRFRSTASTTAFPGGGPWVRTVDPPGAIDAAHEPVLMPIPARALVVYGAVETWATQGGLRDPSPWIGRALKLWSGTGGADVGLLGALKQQYPAPPARGRFVGRSARIAGPWALGGGLG